MYVIMLPHDLFHGHHQPIEAVHESECGGYADREHPKGRDA
jgi:hypothetical protein